MKSLCACGIFLSSVNNGTPPITTETLEHAQLQHQEMGSIVDLQRFYSSTQNRGLRQMEI